jgi:hypothetical protein
MVRRLIPMADGRSGRCTANRPQLHLYCFQVAVKTVYRKVLRAPSRHWRAMTASRAVAARQASPVVKQHQSAAQMRNTPQPDSVCSPRRTHTRDPWVEDGCHPKAQPDSDAQVLTAARLRIVSELELCCSRLVEPWSYPAMLSLHHHHLPAPSSSPVISSPFLLPPAFSQTPVSLSPRSRPAS